MRLRTRQNHIIDFLFPIALFLVFAVSALTVILLATRIYRSSTEHSALNYTARTSLSYISEKIHQNDTAGAASLSEIEGYPALVLTQSHQDIVYKTYIYVYEDELKELFVKDGAAVLPEAGTTILPVKRFSMEAPDDHSFYFSCTDANGAEASTVVAVRSETKS